MDCGGVSGTCMYSLERVSLLWRRSCNVRGSCVLHCEVLRLPCYIGCGYGWCDMQRIGVCARVCVWLKKLQKIYG